MLNRQLLEEVLTYITDHPDEHDQSAYHLKTACGTTHCFAGHALRMSGFQVRYPNLFSAAGTFTLNNVPQSDFELARAALGLAYTQAVALFYDAQTLEDVQKIVKNILNESAAS